MPVNAPERSKVGEVSTTTGAGLICAIRPALTNGRRVRRTALTYSRPDRSIDAVFSTGTTVITAP